MIAEDVIKEIQDKYGEYFEMSQNPTDLLVGILVQKVVVLTDYVEHLEKRLGHVSNIRK
jgi:hypothetical protein